MGILANSQLTGTLYWRWDAFSHSWLRSRTKNLNLNSDSHLSPVAVADLKLNETANFFFFFFWMKIKWDRKRGSAPPLVNSSLCINKCQCDAVYTVSVIIYTPDTFQYVSSRNLLLTMAYLSWLHICWFMYLRFWRIKVHWLRVAWTPQFEFEFEFPAWVRVYTSVDLLTATGLICYRP